MLSYVSSLLEGIRKFEVAWRAAQQEYTAASKQDTESYILVSETILENLNRAHRDFKSTSETQISSINNLIRNKMYELNDNLLKLLILEKPVPVGDNADEQITNALQFYRYVLLIEEARFLSTVLKWEDNRSLQIVYQNINEAHQHCMSISATAVDKMNKEVKQKMVQLENLDWHVVDPNAAELVPEEHLDPTGAEPKAEQHTRLHLKKA